MAAMGRKPKPTNLKLLEGNRGRREIGTDEPDFQLTHIVPPDELDDRAKEEWLRVASMLAGQKVLTDADRATLAGYCNAWSAFVTADMTLQEMAKDDPKYNGLMIKRESGSLMQNPLINVRNISMTAMLKCAVELGMTPSARTRVKVGNAEGKNKKDPAQKFGF